MRITIPKTKNELFFWGFYLFSFGSVTVSIPGVHIAISRSIQLIGICLVAILFSRKAIYSELNIYARIILCLFLVWQIGIIIRDDQFTLWNFQRYFFTPGYLLYLAPILVYKLSSFYYIKLFFNLIIAFCKTSILCIILFFPFMLSGDGNGVNLFEMVNGFCAAGTIWGLLMREYLTECQKKWVYITSFLIIILALILARRSILLTYIVSILVFALYKFKYSLKSTNRRILYLFSSGVVFFIIYLFLNTYGNILFSKLFDRIADDTRSRVELKFLGDIQPGASDFLLGRGISGSYYCPFVEENGLDYREHIESGYLELVLKGGGILVLLFAFLTIPSMFLGLFRSNNNFCKLAAIYCFLFLGFLYGMGSYFTFSIRYILFLFCVFICYKRQFRLLSNDELYRMITCN